MKIKKLTISGIRGVRLPLTLDLEGRSLLLYGPNGSGKSSISDAVEWFYTDRIERLSGEETGRDGIDSLRNVFLDERAPPWTELELMAPEGIKARKTLIKNKKGAPKGEYDNESNTFQEYRDASRKENLILRYADMTSFILKTKKDKLTTFSDLIGMESFTKTREALQKTRNDLSREMKQKDYNSRMGRLQAKLLDLLGRNVTSDVSFLEAFNEKITSKLPGKTVTSISGAEALQDHLAVPQDDGIIKQLNFYNRLELFSQSIPDRLTTIAELYGNYYAHFSRIAGDLQKMRQLALEKLLNEGAAALRQEAGDADKCPLCLQDKNTAALLKELTDRLAEMKGIREEKNRLEMFTSKLNQAVSDLTSEINNYAKDLRMFTEKEVERPEGMLTALQSEIEKYIAPLKVKLEAGANLPEPAHLAPDEHKPEALTSFCKEKNLILIQQRKDDDTFNLRDIIRQSTLYYKEWREIKDEQNRLDSQQRAMGLVCAEFRKMQQNAIDDFLKKYSLLIREYYEFLNPGEKIEQLKLVKVEREEEMEGLAITCSFYHETEAAPQKYLSESHINALGISFFLAVLRAFNVHNRFVVLDDLISSFDEDHRLRFIQLLMEKFPDTQLLVLTHEYHWFTMMRRQILSTGGKEWIINEIFWNEQLGTTLKEPGSERRERIDKNLKMNEFTGAGNMIRQEYEKILKKIIRGMDPVLKLSLAEDFEKKTAGSLYSIAEKIWKEFDIPWKNLTERLALHRQILNMESHDNQELFKSSIGDLKSAWDDVLRLEALFKCPQCGKFASPTKEHPRGTKEARQGIACGCNHPDGVFYPRRNNKITKTDSNPKNAPLFTN